MARTKLSKRGVVTLPAEIRAAARLEEGDPIEVELVEGGILLRPQKVIDATQAWYWTPEWQAGEREADEQYARGEGRVFTSGEEFLAALRDER
jgi:AbrB family looped-hinge helix DNA binding protein